MKAIGKNPGWILLLLLSTLCRASAQESQLGADFRGEGERFQNNCVSFKIGGCAQLLFTDHPLHIAIGSIAPQNGFGTGPAFVAHYTPNENWLLKWNIDGIVSANGSWRGGAYMKIIRTTNRTITVHTGTSSQPKKSKLKVPEHPLFNLYTQTISLNKLGFFGLGPATAVSGRSFFGMTETIAGGNAVIPMSWSGRLNLSLLGEVNGRFVDIRGNHNESSPSIEALYTPLTAPGLSNQPGFLQLGEGVRIRPGLFNNHLKLDYAGTLQEFIAPGNSAFSFRRFNVDLSHEIPFYQNAIRTAQQTNNPNECSADGKTGICPGITRNREGTLNLRFLLTESIATGGSVVPFYFQPTLGGSDVNGNPLLSSYQDYRFRGPHLMLFHAGLEHTIPGLDKFKYTSPLGFFFGADAGKVALARGDLELQHLRHSFTTGLTIRAGGFPQVFVLFAWGGNEGNHTIASINTSLLGGSSRPSLY